MENKGVLIKSIIIGLLLAVSSYSLAWSGEFGPFQGKIVDAETKEPIEGVVVLIEWRELHFFAGSTFYDAQETLTDKDGEFVIPGIWVVNPWTRLGIEAGVIIYKSGYGSTDGIDLNGPWNALLDKEWGAPKGTYIWKFEDGKPIIMLKKLTDTEERRKTIPSQPSVPGERYHLLKIKWKLLRQEINKERRLLGLGEMVDPDGFGR